MSKYKINGPQIGSLLRGTPLFSSDPLERLTWARLEQATGQRSVMFNLDKWKEFSPNVPYLNIMKLAKWTSQPSAMKFEPGGGAYQTGRVPAAILPGDTLVRANLAWDQNAHTFQFGRYVARFTEHAGYTLTVGGRAVPASNAPGRIVFDVQSTGNWRVEIAGPEGPLPDFNISVVREDREALLDGTGAFVDIPADDARRIFNPDYLELLSRDRPERLRFMKPQETEDANWQEIADIPRITDQNWLDGIPIEVMVILCNHLQCGLWFCMWHRAGDALIDFCASYIRDNLDSRLTTYIEEYNEAWNFAYRFNAHYGAVAMKRFATPGAGTLSLSKGGEEVTATGVDLRTIFGASADKSSIFALGDYDYQVDTNRPIEADVMYTKSFNKGLEDIVDQPFWHGRNSFRSEGFAIESTHTMQRWIDVFENAPGGSQRSRLTTLLGAQLQNPGLTERLLVPPKWSLEPDYVAPSSVHDVAAINPYFGNGIFNDDEVTALIEDLQVTSPGTAVNQVYKDLMFGTHPTLASNRDLPRMETRLREQRTVVEPFGLGLISYEGNSHIIHSGPVKADWSLVLDSYDAFMTSPEAEDVFREWAALNMRYLDGPLMVFLHTGNWSHFGYYANYPRYDYPGDSRTVVVDEFADKDPWWGPFNTPQIARPIPDQSWSRGSTPELDLSRYATVNATEFTGSPPSGVTLEPDGTFSGQPDTTAGTQSYTFFVSNSAGSDSFTVNIAVI